MTASKSASYTLTNTSLSSTDGMALGAERDHRRQPHRQQCRARRSRSAVGWGAGRLTGTTTATVTVSQSAGFTLTNSSLSSTDGMSLGLSGITTANLTDTSSGGNTFTVTDWTGKGDAERHVGHPGGHCLGQRNVDQHLAGGDRPTDADIEPGLPPPTSPTPPAATRSRSAAGREAGRSPTSGPAATR